MDAETVRAKMSEQVGRVQSSQYPAQMGWSLEVQDLDLFVTMHRRDQPGTQYLLRVNFADYPRVAPSYRFVDGATRQEKDASYPGDVRHSSGGICVQGTRECHEQIHRQDQPWDPDRYPVIDTLDRIQHLMEGKRR